MSKSRFTRRVGEQIDDAYRSEMRDLVISLDLHFNGDAARKRRGEPDRREVGFVLLVFPFEESVVDLMEMPCSCVSNGVDQDDIIVMFKALLARFEGQPSAPGHA
jgi:hypothetical protein